MEDIYWRTLKKMEQLIRILPANGSPRADGAPAAHARLDNWLMFRPRLRKGDDVTQLSFTPVCLRRHMAGCTSEKCQKPVGPALERDTPTNDRFLG